MHAHILGFCGKCVIVRQMKSVMMVIIVETDPRTQRRLRAAGVT